jgi:hypothetical protein
VDLTKEQIETFPPYDGTALTSEEQWADYERRYRSNAKWVEKPVMHREATDRNITPTTQQQVGAGSGTVASDAEDTAELDAEILDAETELTPIRTEAEMEVSPAGPTLRWSAFEDSLRQRREEVLQASIDNVKKDDAKRAAGETLSERERIEQRKAS